MSLNLKQVKGNFQRLFDKNLTDLVRGLRNNKDNEVVRPGQIAIANLFRSAFPSISSTSALFLCKSALFSLRRRITSLSVSKRSSKSCASITSTSNAMP